MLLRLSLYLFKKLWQTAALILVILAVTITVLKIALPYADGYKEYLHSWIDENYGTKVKIAAITADWQTYGPAMILTDVDFVLPEGLNSHAKVAEIRFELDFWRSLLEQKLLARDLIFTGVKIQADSDKIRELLSAQEGDTESDSDAFAQISELFLSQLHRFAIFDSQVVLVSSQGHQRVVNVESINWLNKNEHHQGQGEIWLGEDNQQTIQLLLDLYGTSKETAFGQLYVKTQDLALGTWVQDFNTSDVLVNSGSVTAESWTFIEKGQIRQSQLQIHNLNAAVTYLQQPHQVTLAGGQLKWQPLAQGWLLKSSDLQIEHNNLLWPSLNFLFEKKPLANRFFANQVSIESLAQLGSLVEQEHIDPALLSSIRPAGMVSDINLQLNANETVTASLKVNNVVLHESKQTPSLTIDQGTFYWQDKMGYLRVRTEDSILHYSQQFPEPFNIKRLDIEANIYEKDGQWQITSKDNYLQTQDLTVESQFHLNLAAPASMQLSAKIGNVDVSRVRAYYPRGVMDTDLIEYLSKALVSGEIDQSRIVWQGDFADFPFQNHAGMFQAYVDMRDVEFNFDDTWPNLTQTNMQLQFENNGMAIAVEKAKILGNQVSILQAIIPNFTTDPGLTLKANISKEAKILYDIFNQSPLKESVGETLSYLNLQGEISGGLQIDIPFDDRPSRAFGNINLNGNSAELPTPSIQFSNMIGELKFDNDKIDIRGMRAEMSSLPVLLDVSGYNEKDDDYRVEVDLKGQWDNSQIRQVYNSDLLDRIDGVVGVNSHIDVLLPSAGDFVVKVKTDADLTQVKLDLPVPFAKAASIESDLSLTVDVTPQQQQIVARLGDMIEFKAQKNNDEAEYSQVLLQLDEFELTPQPLPTSGFLIKGRLNQAEFQPWFDFVSTLLEGENGDSEPSETSLFPAPSNIELDVASLSIYGAVIENGNYKIRYPDDWLIDIDADNVKGQLTINPDWLGTGVKADLTLARLFSKPIEVEGQEIKTANKQTPNKAEATEGVAQEGTQEPVTPGTVAPEPEQNPEKPDDVVASALPDASKLTEENAAVEPSKGDAADDLLSPDELFANFPPIELNCDDCTFFDAELKQLKATITRTDNALVFENVESKSKSGTLTGQGSWTVKNNQGFNKFTINFKNNDTGKELTRLGVATPLRDSKGEGDIVAEWQGMLFIMDVATLNGEIKWRLENGYIADVNTSGAKLFSILSLESIVRKLRLDFRDITSDGFFFSRFDSNMEVKNGVATIKKTQVKGVAGDIDIYGNVNLVSEALDYRLTFAPKLTSSVPVLILLGGINPVIGLGAFALDKTLQSTQVISLFEFDVRGTISDPVFTEVKKGSKGKLAQQTSSGPMPTYFRIEIDEQDIQPSILIKVEGTIEE